MLFFVDSKSDRKTFYFSMVFTCFVTIIAKFGNTQFEEIRIEQVGTKSFELFLYLYYLLAGLYLTSSFNRVSWFRENILKINAYIKSLYLSAGGALVGWGVGIICYLIFIREYEQILSGIVATALLAAFVIFPSYCNDRPVIDKQKNVTHIFKTPKHIIITKVGGIVFIALGSYGLYTLISSSPWMPNLNYQGHISNYHGHPS